MHRTGVPPGEGAMALYQQIAESEGLHAAGLHAYDGHIHGDADTRSRRGKEEFTFVSNLKSELENKGFDVPTIVAGGTPTFPFYASLSRVECSPGTYVFWDFGYAESMPDMPFEIAATLMTRVISKPGDNRLCLDLGHKAVASESAHPRVKFLDLPEATAVTHSEEHLVIETPLASRFKVGDVLYGVPRHICPTVALHDRVVVVRKGRAEDRWKVRARDRALTI
jgi:D-serine deaminase-like pyridoxal phosphate-dependent protein